MKKTQIEICNQKNLISEIKNEVKFALQNFEKYPKNFEIETAIVDDFMYVMLEITKRYEKRFDLQNRYINKSINECNKSILDLLP